MCFALCIVLGSTLQFEGLAPEGCKALFTLLGSVFLWVCGSFPLGVAGLLGVLTLIVTGAGDVNAVLAGFMNSAVLFLIFCFSFGVLFEKTTFSDKIVGFILKACKGNSKVLLLGFLFAATFVSYFMHNLVVIAVLLPIGCRVLETLGQEKLKSNLGKGMMIGLGMCAMIGGCGTPIGASMNVLVLGLLENMVGYTINFGQWCIVAVPATIVMTLAVYFAFLIICKPEKLDPEKVKQVVADFAKLPATTNREKAILAVMILMVVMMVLGTWVPMFTIMNVGLFFLVICTFPGVNFLTWDEINKGMNWQVLVMFGCVNCMVGMMLGTGAVAWLSGLLSSLLAGLPVIAILLLFGVITQILHNFCPVGPALCAMVFPAFAGIALAVGGFPVAVVAFICVFSLGAAYFLPINLPLLVAQGSGYWETKDCLIPGLVPTVVMIVLMAVWFPAAFSMLGFV